MDDQWTVHCQTVDSLCLAYGQLAELPRTYFRMNRHVHTMGIIAYGQPAHIPYMHMYTLDALSGIPTISLLEKKFSIKLLLVYVL